MAKEEQNACCEKKFTVMDGLQFGFGFFLANLIGFLIIGLLGWIVSLVLRATGIVF